MTSYFWGGKSENLMFQMLIEFKGAFRSEVGFMYLQTEQTMFPVCEENFKFNFNLIQT